jgi:branched-chain amino acid transport system permease protein
LATFFQQLFFGISNGMNLAVVAAGLTLIFGVYKTLNLAHGQFFMLGGFATYVFATALGWNFFLALFLSMLIIGVLGVISEAVIFRPLRTRPLTDQLLASLGLFIVLGVVALRIWGDFQARPIGIPGAGSATVVGPLRLDNSRMVVIAVTAVLFVSLWLIVDRTHLGRQIRAMAQDEEMASLLGVPTRLIGAVTFFLGSALAGAAGGLLGGLFNVRPDMGFRPLLFALVIVIFGGLGSILGSILAALFLGIIQSLSIFYASPEVADFVPFLLLLAVLLIKPEGLMGKEVERA